jgi:hypothetical protein
MYSMMKGASMLKDYRQCLETLASAPPERKTALVRALLPQIEAALCAGQSLKTIWQALAEECLPTSYRVFHMTVWRARKGRKPTALSNWEKQKEPAASPPRETEAHLSEGMDPFANLRHLEENRPGFQWRSRQDLKTLVHGIEDSKGNNSAY